MLTLGIAVLLWGSCWKFSEYNPHPDPSYRMLAAKLWAGPLPNIGLRSAHLPGKSHLKYVQHSLYEPFSVPRSFLCAAPVAARQNAPEIDRFIPAVTSRPPPFQSSLHS